MTASELPEDEARLLKSLRAGDALAFQTLIEKYHPSLVRLARLYVPDEAIAEEVAQDTWVGVLHGLERFEGRSSLKTWIFRILTNTAKTRGKRESRSIPFSSAWDPDSDSAETAMPPDNFRPHDDPVAPGHWALKPLDWGAMPEDRLLAKETLAVVRRAIDALPDTQREVITLRDIEGWSAEEVCNALEISETNQRVLLHRARAKVRHALDGYLKESF